MLQFLMDDNIIDFTHVQEQIAMKKRKELLEKHPYKIWKGKDDFWHTYLPNGSERKPVKKKYKKDIEDAVITYYSDKTCDSFKDRFEIWVERQRKCGRSDNTISKYKTDYKRFFEGDVIENKSVQNINDEYISEFILRLLHRKDIPYRALKAMFGYMNGVFEKSRMDKVIVINPCQYVDLPIYKQYCRAEKVKTTSERIVSDEEKRLLIKKLNANYEKNPDIITRYAVELSLYTGMRVGELAGLKWEDIDFERNLITICRSEKYNRVKKEYCISTTKNDKVRAFPLTDEIKDVLCRLKKVEIKNGFLSEYVFSDKNGRVHVGRISDCVRNLTMTKEFSHTKSIHALRRTLNSNLRCSGMSATVAASLLGHTEKVNEQNYTYDVTSMNYKTAMISEINKKTAGKVRNKAI